MSKIRKFILSVLTVLMMFSALNFTPSTVTADDPLEPDTITIQNVNWSGLASSYPLLFGETIGNVYTSSYVQDTNKRLAYQWPAYFSGGQWYGMSQNQYTRFVGIHDGDLQKYNNWEPGPDFTHMITVYDTVIIEQSNRDRLTGIGHIDWRNLANNNGGISRGTTRMTIRVMATELFFVDGQPAYCLDYTTNAHGTRYRGSNFDQFNINWQGPGGNATLEEASLVADALTANNFALLKQLAPQVTSGFNYSYTGTNRRYTVNNYVAGNSTNVVIPNNVQNGFAQNITTQNLGNVTVNKNITKQSVIDLFNDSRAQQMLVQYLVWLKTSGMLDTNGSTNALGWYSAGTIVNKQGKQVVPGTSPSNNGQTIQTDNAVLNSDKIINWNQLYQLALQTVNETERAASEEMWLGETRTYPAGSQVGEIVKIIYRKYGYIGAPGAFEYTENLDGSVTIKSIASMPQTYPTQTANNTYKSISASAPYNSGNQAVTQSGQGSGQVIVKVGEISKNKFDIKTKGTILEIQKFNSSPHIRTTGNGNYNLQATFTVWQSVEQDADGNWVGVEPAIFAATGEPAVITTNADTGYVLSAAIQHSNIDPTSPHYQKLYLIETSYPKGYFTHEQLGTENLVTVDCSTGGPTYHLDIGNTPKNDPITINIEKDAETNSEGELIIPNTLVGTKFIITYYPYDITQPLPEGAVSNGQWIITATIDGDGDVSATFDNTAQVVQQYQQNDGTYRDFPQAFTFPLGYMKIEEYEATEGYYLGNNYSLVNPVSGQTVATGNEPLIVTLADDGCNAVIYWNQQPVLLDGMRNTNEVNKYKLVVEKGNATLDTQTSIGDNTTFVGMEFRIRTLQDTIVDDVQYSAGDFIPYNGSIDISMPTNGVWESPDEWLPWGNYEVMETVAPQGFRLNNTVFTVNYANDNMAHGGTAYIGWTDGAHPDVIEPVNSGSLEPQELLTQRQYGTLDNAMQVINVVITKLFQDPYTDVMAVPEAGAVFTIVMKKDMVAKYGDRNYTNAEVLTVYNELLLDPSRLYTNDIKEYAQITTDATGQASVENLVQYAEYIVANTGVANPEIALIRYGQAFNGKTVADNYIFRFGATNNPIPYYLTIRKTVTGQPDILITLNSADFTITKVRDLEGNEVNIPIEQKVGAKRYTHFSTASINGVENPNAYNDNGDDGTVTLPQPLAAGTYEITEVDVPFGFVSTGVVTAVVDSGNFAEEDEEGNRFKIVDVENTLATGTIEVTKSMAVQEGILIADLATELQKVRIGVYANEDIYSVIDGTTLLYAEGDLVMDGYLDVSGNVTFENLPLGHTNSGAEYRIVEMELPTTMQLTDVEPTVTLVYVDSETPVVTETVSLENKWSSVTISKVDIAGEEVPGALLQVIDNGTVIEEWTSTDTPHQILGLERGKTYVLHEEAAPNGYFVTNDVEFVLSDDYTVEQVVELVNERIEYYVRKVDERDDGAIPGATLQLYDSEGTLLDEWVSTTEDHDISQFVEGGQTYTIVEVEAPFGYNVGEDVEFTVTNTHQVEIIKMVNIAKTLYVQVAKADARQVHYYLAGAEITIYDEHGNIVKDIDGNDAIGITDKNGIVSFRIPFSANTEYYAKETKAPEGYKLNNDKFIVRVSEDYEFMETDLINMNVYDYSIIVPGMGDNFNLPLYVGLMLLSVAGMVFVVVLKRKKQ